MFLFLWREFLPLSQGKAPSILVFEAGVNYSHPSHGQSCGTGLGVTFLHGPFSQQQRYKEFKGLGLYLFFLFKLCSKGIETPITSSTCPKAEAKMALLII